jgi:photosystem II stability/assembly factor-like uncharacterized protein
MGGLRRWGRMVPALALGAGVAACGPGTPGGRHAPAGAVSLSWEPQASGTTASLRGLSVVSDSVAWASGSGGTWLRTTDGGRTWRAGTVPGAAALDFRDVHAFGADTAVLMSAGTGRASQIHRTTDGGWSWTRAYVLPDSQGFLDGITFRAEQ